MRSRPAGRWRKPRSPSGRGDRQPHGPAGCRSGWPVDRRDSRARRPARRRRAHRGGEDLRPIWWSTRRPAFDASQAVDRHRRAAAGRGERRLRVRVLRRHFRRLTVRRRWRSGRCCMEYESLSVLTLPADNGTWGIGIVTSAKDKTDAGSQERRHSGPTWSRACRCVAHWLEGEPLDDGIAVMAKIEDRHRSFMVDGQPGRDRGGRVGGFVGVYESVGGSRDFASERCMRSACVTCCTTCRRRPGRVAAAVARHDDGQGRAVVSGHARTSTKAAWPRSTRLLQGRPC